MAKPTQTSDVLNYMETHQEGITSIQAINMFGATRLAAIIKSLRNRGINIKTNMETCKDRYGSTKRYARYVLVEE